jgi:unsaturated rhamnogalacturonyl hydrolase
MACVVSAAPLPSPTSVLAAMAAADDYFIVHNAFGDCGWTRGTYFAGESAHFSVTGNASLTAFSTAWAVAHNWSCGGPGNNSLDPGSSACGMTYSALYELAPANYKLALLVTLQQAIVNSPPYSWWWVDTLMALGTWYGYGRILQETALWDFAFAQVRRVGLSGVQVGVVAMADRDRGP